MRGRSAALGKIALSVQFAHPARPYVNDLLDVTTPYTISHIVHPSDRNGSTKGCVIKRKLTVVVLLIAMVAVHMPSVTSFLPPSLQEHIIPKAYAAAITWDGGGADTNWSTCMNWLGDVCPGSGDTVTFDNTSSKSVTIDTSINVAGASIFSTYGGTITQAASMTIGASGWTQSGATFVGASQAITVNGGFYLSDGTFTATSNTMTVTQGWASAAGTFIHNSGTVFFVHTNRQPTITTGGAYQKKQSYKLKMQLATISQGTHRVFSQIRPKFSTLRLNLPKHLQ